MINRPPFVPDLTQMHVEKKDHRVSLRFGETHKRILQVAIYRWVPLVGRIYRVILQAQAYRWLMARSIRTEDWCPTFEANIGTERQGRLCAGTEKQHRRGTAWGDTEMCIGCSISTNMNRVQRGLEKRRGR